MKVEAQEQCFDVPMLQAQSDESEDEKEARLSIKIKNGHVDSVCVGVELVPDAVWQRSRILSHLVQSCIEGRMDGEGPLLFSHGVIIDWICFDSSRVEYDAKSLRDILEVRACSCTLTSSFT
jgi:hypothetical protein